MDAKKNRLNLALNHLIGIGLIDGKSKIKSISEKMKRHPSNISAALRGDEKYLTRKMIDNICATYGNVISADWIWDGIGDMIQNSGAIETQTQIFPQEKLDKLSREELVVLVKELINIHNSQNEMYKMIIKQYDEMIRNGQNKFNSIINIINNEMK